MKSSSADVRDVTDYDSSSSNADDTDVEQDQALMSDPGPILLEVATEVCRKVGGIYTVIKTKMPTVVKEWSSRFGLIGIYSESHAAYEFERMQPSELSQSVLNAVSTKYGMEVHYGRWLIDGYPRVFLIDVWKLQDKLDEWRHDLMAGFGNPLDNEVNTAILFGYQAALILKELTEAAAERRIVAQFHEWTSGVGLLAARKMQLRLATVFTTHATTLGRWLSAGRVDLYRHLPHINADAEASQRQIYQRHWIEKEAAHQATVFTTVSHITGVESKALLGREPDIVTPNGLNIHKLAAAHEFQNLHQIYKEKIQSFVMGHWYGRYDFDLDKTLFFFTAGRYEYYNKGVDMYIEALARLNHAMKVSHVDRTVVAFIIMPTKTNQYNIESLKGQTVMKDMRVTCDKTVEHIAERLFEDLARGVLPTGKNMLSDKDIVKLKKRLLYLKVREGDPPICTHNVANDADDEILCHLRRVQLFNRSEDRVKVVFHPAFLEATSPVLPLDYVDFVRGCHLSVFPSAYEPWGYTPAESVAQGVPTITSNVSGFANFIEERVEDPSRDGVFIVDRIGKNWDQSVEQMKSMMLNVLGLTRAQRIRLRNRTERLARSLLGWSAPGNLGREYFKAHQTALMNQFKYRLNPSHSYGDVRDAALHGAQQYNV